MRRLVRLVCVASLLSACRSLHTQERPAPSAPEPWPTEGWPTSTPEAQGFDSDRLATALRSVRERRLDVHSVLLVRNGTIVADVTLFPYVRGTVHALASITKSVTATLIGIAARQGRLDVHRPVLELFPELQVEDPGGLKRQLRVEHLLTMTSGLDCGWRRGGEDELRRMLSSPDWTRFTLELPMATRPGTVFAYCSPNFHLLSAILTRATGEDALTFARRELFAPLGIREVRWPSAPGGLTLGWGGLRLLPGDVAKLGLLHLRGGRWEDRQLLSPAWVEASARPVVQTGRLDAYGQGWWVRAAEPGTLRSAQGRGGQYLLVWPERQLIAVFTGSGYDVDQLRVPILAALTSDGPLPESPAGLERLREVAAELAGPPADVAPAPLPEAARRISGRSWTLEPNALGLRTLSLSFGDGPTATATIEAESWERTFTVGLDGVPRLSPAMGSGQPVASRGAWIGPTQFTFDLDTVGEIDHLSMAIAVGDGGGRIVLHVQELTGLLGVEALRLEGAPPR